MIKQKKSKKQKKLAEEIRFKQAEDIRIRKQGIRTLEILFDGGCKGFHRFGYGSFRVGLEGEYSTIERREYGNKETCNTAEWKTLIEAIKFCRSIVMDNEKNYCLSIKGDSTLVIEQVLGKWKCKAEHLALLRDEALKLLKLFDSFRAQWQSRVVSVAILGH